MLPHRPPASWMCWVLVTSCVTGKPSPSVISSKQCLQGRAAPRCSGMSGNHHKGLCHCMVLVQKRRWGPLRETKAMHFPTLPQPKYAHRKTLMVSRRIAFTSQTVFHGCFSSMLVSFCSRAAFSSWDRVGLGPVDRPQNHKYSIFQQGGLPVVRDGPKTGCYHLAGTPPSLLPLVWRCIDQSGVGFEMHLAWEMPNDDRRWGKEG